MEAALEPTAGQEKPKPLFDSALCMAESGWMQFEWELGVNLRLRHLSSDMHGGVIVL